MMQRSRGFTMIELVVGMTIAAMVVGFIAAFIAVPVRAHIAQARRGELTASAETLTREMTEDVRTALPGSPRAYVDVNGRVVLELIPVLGVVRYCDEVGTACPDKLDFAVADTQFDVAEDSQNVAAAFVAVTDNDPTNAASAQDAYLLTNMIAAADDTTGHLVTLDASFQFLDRSPNNRAFFVSNVTRYECDTNARTLRRFRNLPLPAGFPGPAPVGAPSDVIARDVTACRFTYVAPPPPSLPPAPPQRPQNGGLVVVEITVSRVTDGVPENLRVVKQLRLEHTA
jgi:MSHA biogenesis protein MshO